MKKLLIAISLAGSLHLATAIEPIAVVGGAPQTGVYYSNGVYGGTTMTVNGGTNYYSNGQYQGQAPANTPIFQSTNQGSIENSIPNPTNEQQIMDSTPSDTLNPP